MYLALFAIWIIWGPGEAFKCFLWYLAYSFVVVFIEVIVAGLPNKKPQKPPPELW